jgi:CRISPR-associated protein Csb2
LLRGLVAVWKQKLDGSISEAAMRSLLEQLAEPPQFYLPPASPGHTRHYMPWFKKGPGDKTKVFDTFVALPKDATVIISWPHVNLTAEQRDILSRLVGLLGFLGRAESWCDATLVAEVANTVPLPNCLPQNGSEESPSLQPVRMLCVDPASAFGNEYTPKHIHSEKSGRRQSTVQTPLYDPDWHLCMETLELRSKRWSDPPGSRWVTYVREADCFRIEPRPLPRRPTRVFTVARYVLDAPVLPLVQLTLPIAECVRRALMGIYRRLKQEEMYGRNIPVDAERPVSSVFSGKSADGAPLRNHRHAFFLPTDEDNDGRIDHITVYAAGSIAPGDPLGFGPDELRALDRMRRLRYRDGDPLNLLLIALGQTADFPQCRLFQRSTRWVSATPYVASRHPKRRGRKRDALELLGPQHEKDFAQRVLEEELQRPPQWNPLAATNYRVVPLNGHRIGARLLRPIQFKRFRQKQADDGGRRPAGGFRICFDSEVPGPICLGHSSHFGLGLFLAEES